MRYGLIFMLFIFCSLDLAAKQSIKVVTESHPPVQYESNGDIVGPSTEIVREVLRLSGFEPDISIMPWARAYSLVQENENVLIYSMLRTSNREAKFYWIGPVAKHEGALLALSSRQDLVASSLEDAKQYIVGTVRNSYAHDYLRKQGFSEDKNLFLVATLSEEMNLFVNKRFDFILSDPETIEKKMEQIGYEKSDLKRIISVPALRTDLYLAANLNSNKKWLQAIQKSMQTFQKTKRYQALYEQSSP